MRKRTEYRENNIETIIDEPQLAIEYAVKPKVIKDSKTLSLISLFSGCGGMDLGFEGGFKVHSNSINKNTSSDFIEYESGDYIQLRKTKFRIELANDILNDARNAWVSYFSKRDYTQNHFRTESIVDLVKMHEAGLKVFPENVDILTGGFPCQDFSLSGKRNGFNSHKDHTGKKIITDIPTEETRGKLYIWMKKVIEITQPNIFIAENVKGLVNLSNVKDIIQHDFSSAAGNGYIVLNPKVLHAADYGVPQSRERVIFIGIKKSALNKIALKELSRDIIAPAYDPYPSPTHKYTNDLEDLLPPVMLKDVFKGLKEPERAIDPSQIYYSKAKFMGKHCQGQTEIRLNDIGPTIRAEHHGNIEFRRLAEENGGKHLVELKKGLQERRLTPRECGLIQTFPLDYEFVIPKNSSSNKFFISPSQAYKIIGNAVPPLLAYHIAKRIEKIWPLYFK